MKGRESGCTQERCDLSPEQTREVGRGGMGTPERREGRGVHADGDRG